MRKVLERNGTDGRNWNFRGSLRTRVKVTRILIKSVTVTPHYPSSFPNPLSYPGVKEEKRGKLREQDLDLVKEEEGEYWEPSKVESFYQECCAVVDEMLDEGIRRAFPRTGMRGRHKLTPSSAQILADVLCIEWGLRRLVCKECDFEEGMLKVVLHALLVGTSEREFYGSVADETPSLRESTESPYRRATLESRVKRWEKKRCIEFGGLGGQPTEPNAYKMIAALIARAPRLEFLDLTQNRLDKKSVKWLVGVLPLDQASSSSPSYAYPLPFLPSPLPPH
ncbi:hypothetical protein C8J56DRAFT_896383 [Mycena floridula]|nr:hypothetical protein C8J56DRAFT_896383 [Mycena floridula]